MLSIVMPVWDIHPNIETMTKKAIEAVRKNTIHPFLLTVILNGPSLHDVFEDEPKLILSERVSVAKVYNQGFKTLPGNYLCCLHNDVFVPKNWNVPLQEEAAKGNIAFPKVDEDEDPIPPWMPPGCCFVMKKEIWDKLGGYDERFEDFHCEDTDLFYRALRLGIKLIQCNVTVQHKRGGTRFLLPDRGKDILIRNMKLLMEKHKKDWIVESNRVGLHLPELSERI